MKAGNCKGKFDTKRRGKAFPTVLTHPSSSCANHGGQRGGRWQAERPQVGMKSAGLGRESVPANTVEGI